MIKPSFPMPGFRWPGFARPGFRFSGARLPCTRLLCAAAAAAALAACSPASQPQPIAGTDISGAPIGGEFTLVDKDGKQVSWHDFKGKYRIVYFGYSYCPDACPTDLGVLMRGFAAFAKAHPDLAARVQPILITVDPARDTPAQVGQFAAAFSPRLLGLTGTQAQVDQAIKAFRVVARRGENTPGGYLMDHSRLAYLFGPDGLPIEALPVDKSADAVAGDLAISIR